MTTGDLFEQRPPRPVDLGHSAAQVAADHAERESPGWKDAAYCAARQFIAGHRAPFTAPDIIAAAAIAEPQDPRAWGQVFLRLSREGAIVPTGRFLPGPASGHGCPKREWRPT